MRKRLLKRARPWVLRSSVLLIGLLAAIQPGRALAIPRPGWHPGPPWAPLKPHSSEMHQISNLFWIMLILSGLIFAFVCGLMIINIVRYTAKPGEGDPPQVFGHRRVELAWTIIPTVILLIAFIFTSKYIHNINTAEAGSTSIPMDIYVYGHQWWWEFQYNPQTLCPPGDQTRVQGNPPRTVCLKGGATDKPILDIRNAIITANELHVPEGVSLHFHISSKDVIHSFWTPQLQRQIDANPAQDNAVFVRLDQPGIYDGACYEYCGAAHAWMKYRVVVQPLAQFTAWAKDQTSPAVQPAPGTTAARGRSIFNANTCVSCHAITYPGSPSQGAVGPNLTHFGSRWTIGAGAAPLTKADLVHWIRNPNQYKPGVLMPPYPLLSSRDINDIATYLLSLK